MPYIPPDPLYLLLLYLRSVFDAFAICAFGLQVLGQFPDLKRLFRWSFVLALFFVITRYIPIGWTSQITLLFILLIIALFKSKLAGVFVATAAVMLGFYTLINFEWLSILIRMEIGLPPPVHVTSDFLTGYMHSAPSIIILVLLVLVINFISKRGRLFNIFQQLRGILNRIERKDYDKVIPVAQLFTILLINHTFNSADIFMPRLFYSSIPFFLCIIIVYGAYYRERWEMGAKGKAYWVVSFFDIIVIVPYLHYALMMTGGVFSPYKLLFIPLIVTNIMKQEKVFGYVVLTASFASLISLATYFNPEGVVWDVEKDLVYMGTFLFTGLFVRYYLSEKNKLQIELELQANTDGLTGLFNHSYALKYIEKVAESVNNVLYIIMIDLDNFKTVNDRYGHAAGDELLKRVARSIRSNLRKDDMVARYGGDEFMVVIQKQAGDQEVLALAERIRDSVGHVAAKFQIDYDLDTELSYVTASIGISRSSCSRTQKISLLKLADEALYKAKKQGKNCIDYVDLDTVKA